MSDQQRSSLALFISMLILLLANYAVPPPGLLEAEDPALVVELSRAKPLPDLADEPFLPQRPPDKLMEAPEDPRTADEYNRKVERETMARRANPDVRRPKPAASPAPVVADEPEPTKGLSLLQEDLSLDMSFLEPPGLSFAPGGPRLPGLDVEEGDETWLSSIRVRHGGFFRRLHQSVARHWAPANVMRRHDPTGMLYGTQDRITVLHLKLQADGGLAGRPQVIAGSGLRMLDREAIRAVVAAAPFPHPPDDLVEDGIIDLGRFSFYLQIEHGTFGFRPVR